MAQRLDAGGAGRLPRPPRPSVGPARRERLARAGPRRPGPRLAATDRRGRVTSDQVRLEATARGRVQGVGFRYFVLRRGMELGLTGWVANESDGSVRCVAEGPRSDLEALLESMERRTGRRARRAGQRDVERRHRERCATSASAPAVIEVTDPIGSREGDRWAIPAGTIVRASSAHDGAKLSRRGSADAVPRHPRPRRPPRGGRGSRRGSDRAATGDGGLFPGLGRPGPSGARVPPPARRAADRRRGPAGTRQDSQPGSGDGPPAAPERRASRTTDPRGARRPHRSYASGMPSATVDEAIDRALAAYAQLTELGRGDRGRVVVRQRPVVRVARAPRTGRRGADGRTAGPRRRRGHRPRDRRGRSHHRPAPRDRLAVDVPAGRPAGPRRDAMRFQDAARDGRAVVYAGIQADPLVKRTATLLADATPAQRVLARAVMNGETTDPEGWIGDVPDALRRRPSQPATSGRAPRRSSPPAWRSPSAASRSAASSAARSSRS